jgi:hypothetical protein
MPPTKPVKRTLDLWLLIMGSSAGWRISRAA